MKPKNKEINFVRMITIIAILIIIIQFTLIKDNIEKIEKLNK
jgi:hypothetical protein